MVIDFLLDAFRRNADADAIVWDGRAHSYRELLDAVEASGAWLDGHGLTRGDVVALEGDFSPRAIAMFLALLDRHCCVVPLSASVAVKKAEFLRIAQVERVISVDARDEASMTATGATVTHPLLTGLRAAGHPGLIVFSSGSTGVSKAAVHDVVPLLDKFRVPRHGRRMISFLLFDHLGGINTLLYVLSNGGCLVTLPERTPSAVARAIEAFRVEVLPASPSFLNLLLLSGAHEQHDLSSLRLITYGTEPMAAHTLQQTHAAFPDVELQQTYGLSELGVLRSKSRSSDSLWVKIGGEGFETRVVDGLLEIKAKSAMLGYLNAPSPFTADGWFMTGDMVDVDGEYLRIRGRRSELINVGGEKVYPAEVESVISEMPEVQEVVVSGEPNPLLGHIVVATVRLQEGLPTDEFKQRLRAYCRSRLAPFMIPQRVIVQSAELHSERFKKLRVTL